MPGPERRLAAILFSDIVGYTALMARDEAAGLRARERHRSLLGAQAARYHGEVVDENGDELVLCFPSAVEAVNCALAAQAELADAPELQLRIGIHTGDVIFDAGRVYGDGVNLASRVRPLAEPGGVCISDEVQHSVGNQSNMEPRSLGPKQLKGVDRPVEVFAIRGTAAEPAGVSPVASPPPRRSRLRIALASVSFAIAVLMLALWASWPRPLALVLDQAGLLAPPVDPPLPDKPSVVVLPFTNMSDDPEQEYFSDGITEDLTSALSRTSSLFVISRNSAFTYKGAPAKVEDVGRELGVRYVVEGSVRKAEDRVRITAQLIDATTDFHLWSQSYDRELADIFALQSEISEQIMLAVGLEIQAAEIERVRQKQTGNLSAYDNSLKGIHHFLRGTREGLSQARLFYQRAIELDPNYAAAHAMLGTMYFIEYVAGWNLDPTLLDRATELAEHALELDSNERTALNLMGGLLALQGRRSEARAFTEKAIEAAPNWHVPHYVLASHQAAEGQFLDAIRSANRSLRLNPRPPLGELGPIGAVNFAAGRTERAVELWEAARAGNPDAISARVGLVAVYESQDRHREARAVAQEILRVNPQLTAKQASELGAFSAMLDERRREEIREHLRRAGLP